MLLSSKTKFMTVLLLGLAIALVASTTPAPCVPTDYSKEPGAFCLNSDSGGTRLEWDTQFASKIGGHGKQYMIFDFCHADAFLNEVGAFGRYLAASCSWHEVGLADASGSRFGIPFWNEIAAKKTLHDAFGAARSACASGQHAWCNSGGRAFDKLTYEVGSVAFLMAKRDPVIGTTSNLDKAKAALKENGWPVNDNKVVKYYPDLKESELQQLYDATNSKAYDGKKIAVYIDNHGTSTDVIYSKHKGNRYSYEIDTSHYRNEGTYKYGTAEFYTGIRDSSNLYDVTVPREGWDWEATDSYVRWFSKDLKNPNTWLDPGKAYSFGFSSPGEPTKVDWQDYRHYAGANPRRCNDWGIPSLIDYGIGATVWGNNRTPGWDWEQALGWDNGGDGWVWGPTPEPCSILLLLLGAPFAAWARRRTKRS